MKSLQGDPKPQGPAELPDPSLREKGFTVSPSPHLRVEVNAQCSPGGPQNQ